jgi:hypothetical protein
MAFLVLGILPAVLIVAGWIVWKDHIWPLKAVRLRGHKATRLSYEKGRPLKDIRNNACAPLAV